MFALSPVTRNSGLIPRAERSWFDRLFEDFWPAEHSASEERFIPAFDIAETEEAYTVTAELPGIEKGNISVDYDLGILTISGEKKAERREDKEDFHLVERQYGSFRRAFRVPENVNPEEVDAAYKDGVLTVTLKKSESAKSRKIEVKE